MKYKSALQGNMKWYVFAVFLAAFCIVFMKGGKAHAYTIESHYDDRATIYITKFEIDDNDYKNVTPDIRAAFPSKDQVNQALKSQIVDGKPFYDDNIYDNQNAFYKSVCGNEQSILDTDTEENRLAGKMTFGIDKLHISTKTNTAGGGCPNLFMGTVSEVKVNVSELNNSNIWFRRKDAKTLVRVDGRGGDFSSNETGNANIYQSKTSSEGADGRCSNDGYPNVIIDDPTKSNPIANAQYQTCINDQRGADGFVGVNIDNRGPGGSGGEVVGNIPASTDSGDQKSSCENHNPLDMAWYACGVLGMVNSGLEAATSALDSLLTVNPDDWTTDDSVKQVWSYFRAIASFTLLGVALVMIIGQAIGND